MIFALETTDVSNICVAAVLVAFIAGVAYVLGKWGPPYREETTRPAPAPSMWKSETTTTTHADPSEGKPRRLHPVNDDDLPPDATTG